MELIDDWGKRRRLSVQHPQGKMLRAVAASQGPLPEVIGESLRHIPGIVDVHCYEDVGYPWLHVTFDQTIGPDVAIRVGRALAEAVGDEKCIYFNSLRPRAVYFLLETPFDPKPDLPASRYGAPLAEIEASWRTAGGTTVQRAA